MAGNFHQIFSRIGAGRGEKCRDYFIDRVAILVDQAGESSYPGFPGWAGAKSKDGFGDGAGPVTGKPDNTQPRPAGRSGNGDDGVSEAQRRLAS